MKCHITGLPVSMCAHCSGASSGTDDKGMPRLSRDEDDPNPRWMKTSGRNKSPYDTCRKWVGKGGLEIAHTSGHVAAWRPMSEWGMEQLARSMQEWQMRWGAPNENN